MMCARVLWAAFLLLSILLPSAAMAAAPCPEIPPFARNPSSGSPFATDNKGVTRLDTQTSDNVRITGGCVAADRGHFKALTTGGPATCDGFTAADGTITSIATDAAAKTFRSATAGFTAASVGKLISIRKAGAKFFMTAATVNAGGAGHAVGDLVTFPDGIQIYVLEVSAGAITAFYPVSRGSAATSSATIAQTATSGAGTGAVLAPTWLRENLVTTIAGVPDSATVTLATAASATVASAEWGYGTDYYSEIATALSAGAAVRLPKGAICGHSDTFAINDKMILQGQGIGLADNDNTTLLWLGPPNSPQMTLDADAFGGNRVAGAQIGDFKFEGLGAASKGLYLRGAQGNFFRPLKFINHTTVAYDGHASASLTTINNRFLDIFVESGYADLNAHGVWFGFPNTADTGVDYATNIIDRLLVTTPSSGTGVPMVCGAADHVDFRYVRLRGPTAVPGADLLGANWASLGHCRNHVWSYIDSGLGGVRARGTGYTTPSDNIIRFYDQGNGSPAPNRDATAIFLYANNNNVQSDLRLTCTSLANVQPKEGTPVACINDSVSKVPGDSVAGGGAAKVIAVWSGSIWRILGPAEAPTVPATGNSNVGIIAGTTSASYVQMGLAKTITPKTRGKVLIIVQGSARNTVATNGTQLRLRYGTGAAPANGVAETGTACVDGGPNLTITAPTASADVPFTMTCMLTGLTVDTAYWVDPAYRVVTGGTSSATGVNVQAMEQ